ncbi:MAG: hypothetical protein HYT11_00585 [Candidatus Levybacteria bacterium]|nr:hypothetical protein [Candidatus Levybacteria bacterium]
MYGKEIVNRVADFILGKKVEGTVSAVLPNTRPTHLRYVVETGAVLLDVQVPVIENHGIFIQAASYTFHPQLSRRDSINLRLRNVRPWVDGQTIHFGT